MLNKSLEEFDVPVTGSRFETKDLETLKDLKLLGNTIDQELVTRSDLQLWVLVNYVVVCTGLGLLSLVANIINLFVFAKQGLNNSINISLFCIALSDLIKVVSIEWMAVCWNPYVHELGAPVIFTDLLYLTAGWPTGCAHNIAIFITAYITLERYLCIVTPLKIKDIITPRRTVVVIICIKCMCISYLVPEYAYVYYDWNFYPALNKTMLGMAFRQEARDLKGLTFLIQAILIVFGLISVGLFSFLLISELKKQSTWRKLHTNCEQVKKKRISSRDRKSSVLIAVIAVVMVIVDVPLVTISMVQTFVQDFSAYGKQVNLFYVAWSFEFIVGGKRGREAKCA
ncbi:growth hormone secretagogue receptor type 1 [Biomphalaria glabrata]|nr:growth hormone secretagogue receptor type 1-like [Biomphalaria glabrata]